MFLSALQHYIVAVIIAVIAAQYAFALFCLLKLAYMDVSKKQYVLWNLLILLVFFIGGGVFLWYYYKHPNLHIQKVGRDEVPAEQTEKDDASVATEQDVEQADGGASDDAGGVSDERNDGE